MTPLQFTQYKMNRSIEIADSAQDNRFLEAAEQYAAIVALLQ